MQIDAGAPFKLEVAYLPEKFEFQLTFNDESLARFKIPDSLPDLEIESLILTGDVDMNYVGRKPKGKNCLIICFLVQPKHTVTQNGCFPRI